MPRSQRDVGRRLSRPRCATGSRNVHFWQDGRGQAGRRGGAATRGIVIGEPGPCGGNCAPQLRPDHRGRGCGLLAFGAGELSMPRYVATAQIYIDPSAMLGSDVQPIVSGRDSNSFVSYVESQALIAASQSVLERVVKAQNLDRDPEFSPSAGSSLFGRLMPPDRKGGVAAAAAARALGERLQVERPERTFVLDISVSSRDPARAAELANAAARLSHPLIFSRAKMQLEVGVLIRRVSYDES